MDRPAEPSKRRVWATNIVPYTVFMLVVRMYHWLTGPLNLPFRTKSLYTETPIILAIFATSLVLLRRGKRRAVWAALPVFFIYGTHDYYLWVLNEIPDWTDFDRLPELLGVLSWPGLIAAFLAGFVPLALFVFHLDFGRERKWRGLVLVPWVVVGLWLWSAPGDIVNSAKSRLELKQWSKVRNAQFHGRIFMSVLRDLEQRDALNHLETDATRLEELPQFVPADELGRFEKRNIHIVILESFIDAARLTGARFSRPPMSDEMQALLDGHTLTSFSPHPVGGTAESEFEILCGVPALGAYGYQEFKMLNGAPTECLPRILGRLGYRTKAAHAFKSAMYNRPAAYRSLGFAETVFLAEHDGDVGIIHRSKTSKYVLDETLYEQLVPWVKERLADGEPFLNYTLTMEGHTPHRLDPVRQPVVVEVEPYDETVEVLANKTYYRSRALAHYIETLMALDPEGLIIAVADHLPPIPGQGAFYETWKLEGPERRQFLIVVDRGSITSGHVRRHFHLNQFILDRLTGDTFCADRPCYGEDDTPANRAAYATLLKRGMGK